MINNKEVILLDDNDDINFYNEDVMQETGLFDTVTVFDSPVKLLEEITERIEKGSPIAGYFLVDIKMPEMDGFEFIDELEILLEDFDDQPVVYMLTTSNHKRDHEQFEKSYLAKKYLLKPLMVETILNEFKS